MNFSFMILVLTALLLPIIVFGWYDCVKYTVGAIKKHKAKRNAKKRRKAIEEEKRIRKEKRVKKNYQGKSGR